MKNLTLFLILSLSLSTQLFAQPAWVVDINALPDSGIVMVPVKIESASTNSVVVLSNYMNPNTAGAVPSHIKLTKIDSAGNIIWTYTYNSSLPSSHDMKVDLAGNIYVVGSTMGMLNSVPLIIKVSSSGLLLWAYSGSSNIMTGSFENIYLHGSDVYAVAQNGISKWDTSGVELWSVPVWCNTSCMDNQGQIFFTGSDSLNNNLFKMNSNGIITFSDSTCYYNLLKVDALNNLYALSYGSFPSNYVLEKYNPNCQKLWTFQQLPNSMPFGDLSAKLLFDSLNDVTLVGISDTIIKVSKTGNLMWTKPMAGSDSYIIDADIFNQSIYYVGSRFNSAIQSNEISFEAMNGQAENQWSNTYVATSSGSMFATGLLVKHDGIYGLVNINQQTRVLKYSSFIIDSTDYSTFCVDSVWYDSVNAMLIHIRVVNSGSLQINYPSIQMFSPIGSIVSNAGNYVEFFAQIPNSSMLYTDTILQVGINDFSGYTFRMYQNFGSSVFYPDWCGTTYLSDIKLTDLKSVYPNPTSGIINLGSNFCNQHIRIQNYLGETICENFVSQQINVESLQAGVYFISNKRGLKSRVILIK